MKFLQSRCGFPRYRIYKGIRRWKRERASGARRQLPAVASFCICLLINNPTFINELLRTGISSVSMRRPDAGRIRSRRSPLPKAKKRRSKANPAPARWWGWRGSNPRPLRCERSALTSWATSPSASILPHAIHFGKHFFTGAPSPPPFGPAGRRGGSLRRQRAGGANELSAGRRGKRRGGRATAP